MQNQSSDSEAEFLPSMIADLHILLAAGDSRLVGRLIVVLLPSCPISYK